MALLATEQPNLEVKHYRPAAGRMPPGAREGRAELSHLAAGADLVE